MIELLSKKRPPRNILKSRRQEIEYCLTACGVLKDASRHLRRPGETGRGPILIQRLRQALEHLGPVFSAFGLYMASRVDLLSGHDCLELAAIADQGRVTPIAMVRELVAGEIGCPHNQVFPVFEDEPFASRLLFQSHRACLSNGKAVAVTVIHPELQDSLNCDLELLPVLRRVFPGTARHGVAIDDAITDFRRIMRWQTDWLSQVKAFETLARDTQEFAMLKVPHVYKEICSAQMITLEDIAGMTLGELIAAREGTGMGHQQGAQAVREYTGLEPQTLARRLCMVWLRQALLGGQFPVEWRPEDLVILPNTQIAFTGGVFASLPSDAKKNLWHYLIATSTEDPEKACTYLLRELVQGGQPLDENELRYRFREVVPFRDGRDHGDGVSSNLNGHLFVHWKLLSERGFRPQPHLLCFYRGLFRVLALVRRLAPENDALLEGLQDVRTIAMLAQFQEMMTIQTLGDNLDRYVAMMMQLPRKFDETLTLAQAHHARLQHQGTPATKPRGQPYASTVMIALLLALASVVLLSHHLAASAMAGAWVDKGSAIAFVVLGALLLRAASRAR